MYQVFGIGEILWDVFPDGPRFGGAPANYCCSCAELAQGIARVSIVSAVGDDPLGRSAIAALGRHGVETSNVQINPQGTGKVDVQLDDQGVASYRFAENSAWDQIQTTEALLERAAKCDAVCFGTLGQRGETSRQSIREFLKATPETALRILDVNLRKPFYDEQVIIDSLPLANVLKLNDDELPLLSEMFGLAGGELDVMRQLALKWELRYVALTRGSRGAVIFSPGKISDLPGIPTEVVDTVGAGDAFTAAMTLGLLMEKDIESVNRNAIAVASYVCSKPGATTTFPEKLLQTLSS